MSQAAAQFIEASVQHPEWLKIIEGGQSAAVVSLANSQGFQCTLDDLKGAAKDLLSHGEQPDEKAVDEAASGLSDLESETGYGDDTGFAALYGVAGAILKM